MDIGLVTRETEGTFDTAKWITSHEIGRATRDPAERPCRVIPEQIAWERGAREVSSEPPLQPVHS